MKKRQTHPKEAKASPFEARWMAQRERALLRKAATPVVHVPAVVLSQEARERINRGASLSWEQQQAQREEKQRLLAQWEAEDEAVS